jgi:hypothetical protein
VANLTVTCPACKAVLSLDLPAGQTWFLCPRCRSGVPVAPGDPVLDELEEVEQPEPRGAAEKMILLTAAAGRVQ